MSRLGSRREVCCCLATIPLQRPCPTSMRGRSPTFPRKEAAGVSTSCCGIRGGRASRQARRSTPWRRQAEGKLREDNASLGRARLDNTGMYGVTR
ncbi:unnamed protein product [Ectocarpus sp. CCAP 1310/34]|nr:unnamed protein product [Ectocarpus sp. CCAP 1310/34]